MTTLHIKIVCVSLFLIQISALEKEVSKQNTNGHYDNSKNPLSYYMAPLESPTPSSSLQSENIEKPPPNFLQQSPQQIYHLASQKRAANLYPIYNLKQPIIASGAIQPISTYSVPATSFFPQYLPQSGLHGLQGSFQNGLITPGQGNLFADALHTSLNLFDTPFPRVKPIQGIKPAVNSVQLSHPNINPVSTAYPGNVKINLPQNNALNQQFYQNKPIFPLINNQAVQNNGNLQSGIPIIPHYQKQVAASNGYQLPPVTNGKFSVPSVIHNIETPPVVKNDETNKKSISENVDESADKNEEEEKDDGSNNEEEEDEDEEEVDENENTQSEDEDRARKDELNEKEFQQYKALIDSQFNDESDHYKPWSHGFGHDGEDDDGYEDDDDGDYEGDASQTNVKYIEHDQNSSGSEKKEQLKYKKKQYTKPKFFKKSDKYGRKTPTKYGKGTSTQPVVDSMAANSNIPVIHKQKVYKERWFVSEDSHDSTEPKS